MKTIQRTFKISLLSLLISAALLPLSSQAESLSAGLTRILDEHPLMKAVNNDVMSAKEQIGVERSGWFPRVTLRGTSGHQKIDRDGTINDGKFSPSEATIGVNQLVWDFGTTNAAIDRAATNFSKEELERATQRSNMLLAGIDAHMKLLRAQQQLDFSKQSEENIKRQTQLENIRIESGKGYTTDLLQAKSQLAGAQARRVGAKGAVEVATNRYKAVFGDTQTPTGRLENVREPAAALPATLDAALALVETSNPDLLAARARAELKGAEREAIRTKEWMPRVDLQAESSGKHLPDGAASSRKDDKVMLVASWSFDTGMRANRATDAAGYALISEQEKALYVAKQATEETRNAWADLTSARERLAFLKDQVDIANRFLDLARKEREMGRRSLLDVLQGETNLINAQADAAAAESDVVLTSFRVLRAVGKLEPALVVAGK